MCKKYIYIRIANGNRTFVNDRIEIIMKAIVLVSLGLKGAVGGGVGGGVGRLFSDVG